MDGLKGMCCMMVRGDVDLRPGGEEVQVCGRWIMDREYKQGTVHNPLTLLVRRVLSLRCS